MPETRREVAERVAERFLPYLLRVDRGAKLIDAIEAALKERDERAARIAETHSAADCDGPDCGVVIAAAIRNEVTNA